MKSRYVVAGMTIAGAVAVTAVPIPTAPSLSVLAAELRNASPHEAVGASALILAGSPRLSARATTDAALSSNEPPLSTWSREIAPGETLDAVLAEGGLSTVHRAEIALALGAEYDLRQLRPGQDLTVVSTIDGTPRRVTLTLEDGTRIEAVFGERLATRVIVPEPEIVDRAGEAVVESSLFAALDRAGIPARFSVDLAQMLGGDVDFRRDLSGGETLRLLWREARVGGKVVGQPEITFAALDLGEALYEIVWPDDGSGRATIYRDGELIRVFAQPVEGARLSSIFGRRRHPVYGDVRMHTGVDFAAARGTLVLATAPGRVSFIGRRNGYGRVVEIAHGSRTTTLYAHLSAVPDRQSVGDRVEAGDIIGRVGATGTVTSANLHYEVRVDGRPTDPISDDQLALVAGSDAEADAAFKRLRSARAMLESQLPKMIVDTGERL